MEKDEADSACITRMTREIERKIAKSTAFQQYMLALGQHVAESHGWHESGLATRTAAFTLRSNLRLICLSGMYALIVQTSLLRSVWSTIAYMSESAPRATNRLAPSAVRRPERTHRSSHHDSLHLCILQHRLLPQPSWSLEELFKVGWGQFG